MACSARMNLLLFWSQKLGPPPLAKSWNRTWEVCPSILLKLVIKDDCRRRLYICSIFLGLHYPVSGATTVIITTFNKKYQQKSIPVGCVPSAAVAVGGRREVSAPGGLAMWVSARGVSARHPPGPCEQDD